MIQPETETGTQLKPEWRDYFGGKYALWERLKLGGTGSPKVTYVSGVPTFDRLRRDVAGGTPYVSFELFRNGLILRFNDNQRHACVGTKLDELTSVELTVRRVPVRPDENATDEVQAAELTLTDADGPVRFRVARQNLDGIRRFFGKPALKDKFQSEVEPF